MVEGRPGRLKAHVYNTIDLDDCSDAQWKKLDAATIKKQFKAWAVIMNGPRCFLMNRISASKAGRVTDIGGLGFHEFATVDMPVGTLDEGAKSKPSSPHTIKRSTGSVFEKGNPVHQLVDLKGNVHVMQSFAMIEDTGLTIGPSRTSARGSTSPRGGRIGRRCSTPISTYARSARPTWRKTTWTIPTRC